MTQFPFAYEPIAQTTWAYLSSLLMLALFFKFNRFFCVRNLDLVLIVLLAPGILMVDFGQKIAKQNIFATAAAEAESNQRTAEDGSAKSSTEEADAKSSSELKSEFYQLFGYIWLLSTGLIFLIRFLLDPLLVRRPALAPNLSIGGLVFLGCTLLTFLFANVITAQPSQDDIAGAQSAVKLLKREAAVERDTAQLEKHGPGFPLFHLIPIMPMFETGEQLMKADVDLPVNERRMVNAAKSLAIFAQLTLVIGLVVFGHLHFNNFRVGVGMAVIYLMLPYTSIYTGHVLHVLPGALLVWSFVTFRKPWIAGAFIGLAIGVSYYPLFLLPLWISFYWEKGVRSFVGGVMIALALCIAGLSFTSVDIAQFLGQLRATFGFWLPQTEGLQGIWGLGLDYWFRLPVLVLFVVLSVSFVLWPIRKNLGTLFAYTCVLMLGVQFWHGFGGGEFMAWYVPMALMTIFRPAMDGRVAAVELRESRPARSTESPEDLLPAA